MVFSLRQLQGKGREERQPLFVVFIDLTKDFDLVSRDGLFKILPKMSTKDAQHNPIVSR